MAGGKQIEEFVPSPEDEKRWKLARRTDLANAFGLVVSVPAHGQDEEGRWRYGLSPIGGIANSEFVEQFKQEIGNIVSSYAATLVGQGILTQEQADAIETHEYSVGPAAQEWPQFFFEFYHQAMPVLTDGATILAWGYFLKDLVKGLRYWSPQQETASIEGELVSRTVPARVIPVMTEADLVAVCYADVTNRYGIGGKVIVESFPRSNTEYETPDHPGKGVTYLIRIRSGKRQFHYLADSEGKVLEHYLVTGKDLTLLALPTLFDVEDYGHDRDPKRSRRLKIKP